MRPGHRFLLSAALLAVAAAVVVGVAFARADEAKKPATTRPPIPAWESMKTLQGDWEGTYDGKMPTKVSYRLVSNGTTLMETLTAPGHVEMVTMYHPDGARLAMTHYCSDQVQPRMRASGTDGKRIAFEYVDATNLPSEDAPRMTALVVTLKDPDHITQDWTHSGGGQSMTARFEFTRKK
jgi:hypothetical protein